MKRKSVVALFCFLITFIMAFNVAYANYTPYYTSPDSLDGYSVSGFMQFQDVRVLGRTTFGGPIGSGDLSIKSTLIYHVYEDGLNHTVSRVNSGIGASISVYSPSMPLTYNWLGLPSCAMYKEKTHHIVIHDIHSWSEDLSSTIS